MTDATPSAREATGTGYVRIEITSAALRDPAINAAAVALIRLLSEWRPA